MKKVFSIIISTLLLLCGLCSCDASSKTTDKKQTATMQLSIEDIKLWVSDGFQYYYGDVIEGEEVNQEKTFDGQTVTARFVYQVPDTKIGYYNSPKVGINKSLTQTELENKKEEGYTSLSFYFAFEKPNPYVETKNGLSTADIDVLDKLNGEYSLETFRLAKAAQFMKPVQTYQNRLLNHWYLMSYQLSDLIKHYALFTEYMPLMATGTINTDGGTVYLSDFVYSN